MKLKIAMVGPSRVGKTSLIQSIISEGTKLLGGTTLTIALDDLTRGRIDKLRNQMQGCIEAGWFNPKGLRNTDEKHTYSLTLGETGRKEFLDFEVLDYPGKWLDDLPGDEPTRQAWRECEAWIADSTILVVPVDATVLMEALLPEHRQAINRILARAQVETLARRWAKSRKNDNKPGALLFCPLKCESYFADNGGNQDRSGELEGKIREFYGPVIEAVWAEAGRNGPVSIIYAPVDTLGCVVLSTVDWPPDPAVEAGLTCKSAFRVRPPRTQQVKGASAVLCLWCLYLLRAERTSRGWFQNLIDMIIGKAGRRNALIQMLERAARGDFDEDTAAGLRELGGSNSRLREVRE